MAIVDVTPVRMQAIINTPFRVLVLLVFIILAVIIVINAG